MFDKGNQGVRIESEGSRHAFAPILSCSCVPAGRRFFSLGKQEEAGSVQPGEGRLSRDNRALLQEALFDLLECKRLLDQVR